MAYAAGYVGGAPASGGALGGHVLNAAALRAVRYGRSSTVYISGYAYIKRRTSSELTPGVSVTGNGIRLAKPEAGVVVPAYVSGNGIRLAKPEASVAPGVSATSYEVRRSPARGDLCTPVDIEHTGEWVQLVKDTEPEPVSPGVSVTGDAIRSARPAGEMLLGSLTVQQADPRIRRTTSLWSSQYAEGSINGFGAVLARAPVGGYPRGGQQWASTRRIAPAVSITLGAINVVTFKPAQIYLGVSISAVDGRVLVRPQRHVSAAGEVTAPVSVRHYPSPRSWFSPVAHVTGSVRALFRSASELEPLLEVSGHAARRSAASGEATLFISCRAAARVTSSDGATRVSAFGAAQVACQVWLLPQVASVSGQVDAPADISGFESHHKQTGGDLVLPAPARSAGETHFKAAQGEAAPYLHAYALTSGKRARPAEGGIKVPASVVCSNQVVMAAAKGACAPGVTLQADMLMRPIFASGDIVPSLRATPDAPRMRRAAASSVVLPIRIWVVFKISDEDMAPAVRRTVIPVDSRDVVVPGEHRVIEVA